MSDEGLATEEYLEAEKQKLRKDIDALERITFGGPIQFIDRLQKTWDWIAERSFRWPRVPVLLWRLGMLGICTTFFTALFLVTVATILEIVLTQAQSGGINLLASLAVAHIISEATAKLFCLVSCAGLCLTFTGDYFPFGAAHEEAKIYALQKYLSNLRGHGPNHTKAPAEDRSDRFAKQAQDDTTALRRVLRAAVISVIFVGGFVSFWDTSDYSLALPEDTAKQVSNHAVFAVEWALNWLPLWVATVTLVATIITVLIICAVRLVTFIPAVACGNQNFTGQDHRTVRLLQYLFTPAPQHVVKEIRTIMQIHSGFTLMLVLVAIAVVKAMRLENMAVFPSCEWLVFRNTAVIASVLGLIACYIDFLLRNFRRARDAAKAAWRFVWCCGRKSPLTPAPASASASPQGASAPSEGSLATTQIAATPAEESPRDTQGAAASGEESLPAARPTTTELAADAKPAALPQSNITPGTPRESWACSSLVNLFWSSGTNGVMTTAGAIYLLALLVGVGTLPISHSSKALCMGLAVMIGLSSFYPTPRDGLCSFVWRVLVLVVSMAFFALSLAYGSAGENQSKWTPVIGNWATTPATVAYPVCGLTVNSLTIAEHCLMTAAAYSDAGNASHAFNTWFPNGISANHPLGGWHLEDLTLGGSAPRYIHMKNNLTNSSAVFIRGTSTMDDWLHVSGRVGFCSCATEVSYNLPCIGNLPEQLSYHASSPAYACALTTTCQSPSSSFSGSRRMPICGSSPPFCSCRASCRPQPSSPRA